MSSADRKLDAVPMFRLVLRPRPTCADPIRQLRQLLMRALRSHYFACTSVEQVSPLDSSSAGRATR
jgi:hypothetical protein